MVNGFAQMNVNANHITVMNQELSKKRFVNHARTSINQMKSLFECESCKEEFGEVEKIGVLTVENWKYLQDRIKE